MMALCHFCEKHGPSIMVTCQKEIPNRLESSGELLSSLGSDTYCGDATPTCSNSTDLDMSSLDSFASSLTISSRDEAVKKTDLCQACRSFSEDEQGFVSHDRQTGARYTTTQHPSNPDVFRLVRQACVRSLSCEVCPGREGPILFGDKQLGYVISYTFYIKDRFARGRRRWYSIIYIMMDRVFLVQSWPFLVGSIGRVVEYLQVTIYSLL